jgi:hypothetical protein
MLDGSVPPTALYRSIYPGRVVYATPSYVLEESDVHIVTAVLPGFSCRLLVGSRMDIIAELAAGREQTEDRIWDKHTVVWHTRYSDAHTLGHFFDAESGRFKFYYVNLQAPVRRTPLGIDSMDHVLDIVVMPNGEWHWKDKDELDEAVRLGIYSDAAASDIHREGERAIASLPARLPTGWETWRPNPNWPPLQLPEGWERL